MYLGIEIGGTKLQLGVGRGDGEILHLWRGMVEAAAGGEGIRRQIVAAVPELLAQAKLDRGDIRGVGVGFGGPTDDATQTVLVSHQVEGWSGFPLADWLTDTLGWPAVIGNDADVAGLGEALFGAGKGLSPIFYVTVGTGVGGGLIINGEIYRGVGRGAAEIGHLAFAPYQFEDKPEFNVEMFASGAGIEREAASRGGPMTVKQLATAARAGNEAAAGILSSAVTVLAAGIIQVITLLCPRRIVIGGGVSLMGEDLFFTPLREVVERLTFPPFAWLTDIVPAALGEAVVVHGALALARRRFGG